jgi:hypothetical protein
MTVRVLWRSYSHRFHNRPRSTEPAELRARGRHPASKSYKSGKRGVPGNFGTSLHFGPRAHQLSPNAVIGA